MNKTAIKNFAIWARRKLISDITYKAGMLGVSENGITQPLQQSTRDLQFFDIGTKDYAEISGVAIEQRNALIKVIQAKEKSTDYKTAFRNVIEEVAYTWFNRLIAVRFMEVNDYLPSRVRVLSSENEGKLEPDFVTNPFDTDLEFSQFEKDRVLQLKDENKLDELFRMLFIKQCNKLSEILPGLFETISDYTELLLNISFTDKDGIVYHLTHDISEDEFNVEKEGQVEIIGWMYQYYNTELNEIVYDGTLSKDKISKELLPAATTMYTPDWAVHYMVENSLGCLWEEGHPNENLKGNWKYYLEEAEQEPDVVVQLNKIREEYAKINPVDIKLIDPCMGSGHILVYAFDVLMQIYISQGYVERDAAKSILQNNLFGIDIDVRAYQLAYFAVMMKARQYNRRIFQENIIPNLIAIRNPESISKAVLKRLGGLEPMGLRLVEDFEDAEEYGSILQVDYTEHDLQLLEMKLEEVEKEAVYGNLLVQMEAAECVKLIRPLIKQARMLSQKYDVVVTNPPYLGSARFSNKMGEYVKAHASDVKSDLSMVMYKCAIDNFAATNRFISFITTTSWMYLSSFEELREYINKNLSIVSLVEFGTELFDGKVGHNPIVAWVSRKNHVMNNKFRAIRLVDYCYSRRDEKETEYFDLNNHYVSQQACFSRIPGSPIAYWISDQIVSIYSNSKLIKDYGDARQGIATGENDRFMRFWYEPCSSKTACPPDANNKELSKKWFPYHKGGEFRKWYGNNDYVVNWEDNGKEIKNFYDNRGKLRSRPQNLDYAFRKCVTWSLTNSSSFGARFRPDGFLFDINGMSLFVEDYLLLYALGFLCSNVANMLMRINNPTLASQAGDIARLPFIVRDNKIQAINDFVKCCIADEKEDWDAFETSWDFNYHPLLPRLSLGSECIFIDDNGQHGSLSVNSALLSECFDDWREECKKRFDQLKANEEELNRIFIDIYGLQDELTPDVADKDVTVRKADLGRDIRSLISYAVGCMFGRYSLDISGLVFAGGEWDASQYKTFVPDLDNCIPITDEEYFADDIVGRFVEFVRVVYGAETLEENLDFVASALGNKGNTSLEVIRNYFLNDFYKDHLKIYQKRPIYWLFDSGKQNGFKALVYMHRWNADTVGNLRIEYLHKMQNVYEHEIETCQEMIVHGTGHDVAMATKRKEKLVKQIKECKDYDALVAHIAFSKIDIDLDDGVKVNYRKVQTAADGKFCEILANSKDIMAKEK